MNMKEFPNIQRPRMQGEVVSFTAQAVVMCGCGNPNPLVVPHLPGITMTTTCGRCKRGFVIGGFSLEPGKPRADVLLGVQEPSIIAPPTNIAQG